MIRRPPVSTQGSSSAASDVYKRQVVHLAGALVVCRPEHKPGDAAGEIDKDNRDESASLHGNFPFVQRQQQPAAFEYAAGLCARQTEVTRDRPGWFPGSAAGFRLDWHARYGGDCVVVELGLAVVGVETVYFLFDVRELGIHEAGERGAFQTHLYLSLIPISEPTTPY